jgi:hypothetical protein
MKKRGRSNAAEAIAVAQASVVGFLVGYFFLNSGRKMQILNKDHGMMKGSKVSGRPTEQPLW